MGNADSQFPYKTGREVPYTNANGWKLFEGTTLSNGDEVTIFSLEKKMAGDRGAALATNAMRRLKTLRHPTMIRYIDGVETPTSFHIVTEPLHPLQLPLTHDNISGSWPSRGAADTKAVTSSTSSGASSSVVTSTSVDPKASFELSLSLALYQIVSAISWLNNEAKVVHANIGPSSIFISRAGDWKLGGVDLLYTHGECNDAYKTHHKTMVATTYRSPELSAGNYDSGPSWATDSWALGCLLYQIYNGALDKPQQLTSPGRLPSSLLKDYKRLLATAVTARLNPAKLLEGPFFTNELVASVTFLEQLALKNAHEKDIFFTGFVNRIEEFPVHTCKYKILPSLIAALEFGTGLSCFAALLTSTLKIGAMLSPDEYNETVIPAVVKLFSSNERSIRVHLLQHLSGYANHLSSELVNDKIFPHVITGFTDSVPMLRELTVKSLTHLVPKLDAKTVDTKVLPHLATCQTDNEAAIRTNTTYCLAKIAPHLSVTMRDRVLAAGFARSLRDTFAPARIAGLTSFLHTIEYHSATTIAQRIIPAISPLAVDPVRDVRDACFRCLTALVHRLTKYSVDMPDNQATSGDINSPHNNNNNNNNTTSSTAVTNGAGGPAVSSNGSRGTNHGTSGGDGSGVTSVVGSQLAGAASMVGSWALTAMKSRILGDESTPSTTANNSNAASGNKAVASSSTSLPSVPRMKGDVRGPFIPSSSSTANGGTPSHSKKPSTNTSVVPSSSWDDDNKSSVSASTSSGTGSGWQNDDDDFFADIAADSSATVASLTTKPKKKADTSSSSTVVASKKAAKKSIISSSLPVDIDTWDDTPSLSTSRPANTPLTRSSTSGSSGNSGSGISGSGKRTSLVASAMTAHDNDNNNANDNVGDWDSWSSTKPKVSSMANSNNSSSSVDPFDIGSLTTTSSGSSNNAPIKSSSNGRTSNTPVDDWDSWAGSSSSSGASTTAAKKSSRISAPPGDSVTTPSSSSSSAKKGRASLLASSVSSITDDTSDAFAGLDQWSSSNNRASSSTSMAKKSSPRATSSIPATPPTATSGSRLGGASVTSTSGSSATKSSDDDWSSFLNS